MKEERPGMTVVLFIPRLVSLIFEIAFSPILLIIGIIHWAIIG